MGRIAVIFNPNARRNSKDPSHAGRLRAVLGDAGEVFESDGPDDLNAICAKIAAGDADLIGICGGDGTNHIAVSALIPAYREAGRGLPPLLFLKGGSMNTIAWGIGQRSRATNNLSAVLALRESGETVPTTRLGTIRVNGWHGFIYGNGYAVNFLEEYYALNSESGPRRAAELVSKAIASIVARGDLIDRMARRFDATIEIDGEALPESSHGMILAGCAEYVGLGFKPLYRAREEEGRFHAVVSSLSPSQILVQLHRFFSGTRLDGEPHADRLAQRLVVAANEPLGYFLDGEIYRSERIEITPGPVLTIATP